MEEFYNKHYVRLDTNGSIIKAFSDAFEQPEANDICVNEQGGRHFELDSVSNPPVINTQGQPIYHFTANVITEWTEEERNTLYHIAPPAPTEAEVLKEQLSAQQIALDTITQELLPSIVEMLG